MKRTIFVLILFLFTICSYSQQKPNSCENFTVEIKSRTTGDIEKEIFLKVKGAEKPLYYVFYRESGETLNTDFTSPKLRTTEKGTIRFAVRDGRGCRLIKSINLDELN